MNDDQFKSWKKEHLPWISALFNADVDAVLVHDWMAGAYVLRLAWSPSDVVFVRIHPQPRHERFGERMGMARVIANAINAADQADDASLAYEEAKWEQRQGQL